MFTTVRGVLQCPTPVFSATGHCEEAVLPLMSPLVTTPTLGDEDVFDVLFMSLSQLESRLGTKSSHKQCYSSCVSQQDMEKVHDSPSEENVTKSPEKTKTFTRPSPTPELKQPLAKRKRLNTTLFSYPSKQKVKKAAREKIQAKQSMPIIDIPPLVAVESSSPPLKKARLESESSETKNSESLSLCDSISSPERCEPVNAAVVSVEESVIAEEKSEYLSNDYQTETETQEIQQFVRTFSQAEQQVHDVEKDKQTKETILSPENKPLRPIESISRSPENKPLPPIESISWSPENKPLPPIESISRSPENKPLPPIEFISRSPENKPLPPIESISAVLETPPSKAEVSHPIVHSSPPVPLLSPPLPSVSAQPSLLTGSLHQPKAVAVVSTVPLSTSRYIHTYMCVCLKNISANFVHCLFIV